MSRRKRVSAPNFPNGIASSTKMSFLGLPTEMFGNHMCAEVPLFTTPTGFTRLSKTSRVALPFGGGAPFGIDLLNPDLKNSSERSFHCNPFLFHLNRAHGRTACFTYLTPLASFETANASAILRMAASPGRSVLACRVKTGPGIKR